MAIDFDKDKHVLIKDLDLNNYKLSIHVTQLKGKHIEFYDKERKYRIGKVKRIHNNSLIVSIPGWRFNMRVRKEQLIGQITHKFKREVVW